MKAVCPNCLFCILLWCTKAQGIECISQFVALSFILPAVFQLQSLEMPALKMNRKLEQGLLATVQSKREQTTWKDQFLLIGSVRKQSRANVISFQYCTNQLQMSFCLKVEGTHHLKLNQFDLPAEVFPVACKADSKGGDMSYSIANALQHKNSVFV